MTRTSQPQSSRVLLEMLTRMRPAGSKTERRFIREYIEPLGVTRDAAGNLIKRIGGAPILWSSHTDTVHRQGGNQLVTVESGIATLSARSKSNCLGADDTVGVWLMCEMIRADVPGLYVFHRGEEIGGVGSSHIAERTPELLSGIKCAIALDRKGYSSIITHQGARCCSDEFASSLASALGVHGLEFKADDTGTFTDTANYTELIGECTNLSVGYARQHTAAEALDLNFALRLRDALIELDTSQLIYSREPGEIDPLDRYWHSADLGRYMRGGWSDLNGEPYGEHADQSIEELVKEYPEAVARILEEWGYDARTLKEELYEMGESLRL